MKWEETTASRCRYGNVIGDVFVGGDVVWERADDDYQGFANVFVAMPDGTFVHYEWTYGSCSGCDEWEGRGLSDEQILEEVRRSMAVLEDVETARRYLRLEGEFAEAPVPTANSPTNASIPGMLRVLSGAAGSELEEIGEAFAAWLKNKGL